MVEGEGLESSWTPTGFCLHKICNSIYISLWALLFFFCLFQLEFLISPFKSADSHFLCPVTSDQYPVTWPGLLHYMGGISPNRRINNKKNIQDFSMVAPTAECNGWCAVCGANICWWQL